jgi:gluconolactonase
MSRDYPVGATAAAWDRDRTILRFPDPAVVVLDERFRDLVPYQEVVERLWTGGRWLEGPVWFGDRGELLLSDIPNDRILRWSASDGRMNEYRRPAHFPNGNTRDRQGRLITCEHETRRVVRTEHDGSITVLLDRFDGKPLNAPNDVVTTRDGAVWFTDPGWGLMSLYEGGKAEEEIPCAVYRIDPGTGEAEAVVTDMARPNGIAFSPDESILYVVDTHVRAYDMVDGRPRDGRWALDMDHGTSDGIRVDDRGNIWAAAGRGGDGYDGVHCFAPDGTLIGMILLPEAVANLAFGGPRRNRLFIAASRSLYSVLVESQGCAGA